MNAANYFIQTSDGMLHGYVRLDVLLCHISENRANDCEPPVFILEIVKSGFSIRYAPVTEVELRARMAS